MMMQSLVRNARRSLLVLDPITLRAPVVLRSSGWSRTLCGGATSPTLLPPNSNQATEGGLKVSNENCEMDADEAAKFRLFEQWTAKYGKVYRNKTETKWRFCSFKGALDTIQFYKDTYGGGDVAVLNEFSAEFPGEWFIRLSGYTILPVDSKVKEGNRAGVGKKNARANHKGATKDQKECNSAGVGKKIACANHKGADKVTLLRWFDQWMAEYGKVYPNEAEKAMRFKYFKKTVRAAKSYCRRSREGDFFPNEFAAQSPKDWLIRSQPCTLSPHVIDQQDPFVRKYFGIRKVI